MAELRLRISFRTFSSSPNPRSIAISLPTEYTRRNSFAEGNMMPKLRLFIAFAWLIAGCTSATPETTPTATLPPTRFPTRTPSPTPTSSPTPAPTATLAPPVGQILFQSNRGADLESYIINADGSNTFRLGTEDQSGVFAAWSPDGARIALTIVSEEAGNIYLLNTDGTGLTRVTTGASNDALASWSPDGERLVFVSNRDGDNDIYVINADGSNLIQLTNDPSEDSFPAWSPDGDWIAFASTREGLLQIYLVRPNATGLIRISDGTSNDSNPAWSPDGERIAFNSTRRGNVDIYAMDADGANVTRLTTFLDVDWLPSWSYDGQHIAFTSERDGNQEIYVMNADGSSQTRITFNAAEDWYPIWSPANLQLSGAGQAVSVPPNTIAYTLYEGNSANIYLMSPDGDNQTQVTFGPGPYFAPSWSPDGGRLAGFSFNPVTGATGIWVMELAIGSQPRTLHSPVFDADNLAWSPDGQYLYFSDVQNGGEKDVYRIDVASGELTVLTADSPDWDNAPSVSPDGQSIAFVSDRPDQGGGLDDIWIMKSDGSIPVNLTHNGFDWEDTSPAFSPDGRKIAFYRWNFISLGDVEGGPAGLWVMNTDGSNPLNLVPFESALFSQPPVWSPDGRYIAYTVGSAAEELDIWIVPTDGGAAPVQLTEQFGFGWEGALAWSTDSQQIIFTRIADGERAIYIVNIDGTGLRIILEGVENAYADWWP